MIASFPRRATSGQCVFLLLALLAVTGRVIANAPDLVNQGQRAFQNGDFSQAAADWKKAVEAYRGQRNTDADIQTSLQLATAYQALGQQRRAVQMLEETLARAEISGERSRVSMVKGKL